MDGAAHHEPSAPSRRRCRTRVRPAAHGRVDSASPPRCRPTTMRARSSGRRCRARCSPRTARCSRTCTARSTAIPSRCRGSRRPCRTPSSRSRTAASTSTAAIDLRGTARALFNNLAEGDREGGSTITQQLAKNLYFHGQSADRVAQGGRGGPRDRARARVDQGRQILQAYLNTAYFGRGVLRRADGRTLVLPQGRLRSSRSPRAPSSPA